jgi:hypothetical protein
VRKLGSAISGDYHAIGNTLMTSYYPYSQHYRNILFKESSDTVEEGDIPSTNSTIEAAWLYWSGWIESGAVEIWSDSCDDFNDWDDGSHWSIYPPYGYGNKEFEGQGGGSDADRTLTLNAGVVPPLDEYPGQEVTISWSQREVQTGYGWPWPSLEPGDCLKYAFSGDGGGSWSEDFVAFCDDNPPPSSSFSDTIPDEYLTDSFTMRFFLDFDEYNEYCYIDDITISVSSEGSSVADFKVNRVLFGTAGNMTEITTDEWQVAPTPDAGEQPGSTGGENSWCYSCFYDATDIVTALLDPDTKSGTFTLGHVEEGNSYALHDSDPPYTVSGTTDYPLATPALSTASQYMWTYAGWSLVIIYDSPETKGHQLYLFDDLHYVQVHTTMEFPITGFIVPKPIEGEENAAHITCFVGDGDEHWPYDFIALLDDEPSGPSYLIPDDCKLWDGITCNQNSKDHPNNVWNSQSTGLDASGIDIDNFNVSWNSSLLEEGDTSAWMVLGNASSNPNAAELIMVIYIILSFRSETTSRGSVSYLIK